MYAGVTRNPIITQTTTTVATNRNPIIDNPSCRTRSRMVPSLSNPAADALEREARNVVPVEPDEERAPAQVIVRHEAPVPAVVAAIAIIAHHEVISRRHLAGEFAAVGIVFAVFAPGKRAHLAGTYRRHCRIGCRDVNLVPVSGIDRLLELVHRLEAQALEVAIRSLRFLR